MYIILSEVFIKSILTNNLEFHPLPLEYIYLNKKGRLGLS